MLHALKPAVPSAPLGEGKEEAAAAAAAAAAANAGGLDGRACFAVLRPAFAHAYGDAKDWARDDGRRSAGPRLAPDDYVAQGEEFRLFCAYLVIYAAMVRAAFLC